MVNHLTLSVLIGAVVVLMMAIFVNHTERLILQLKVDVEKSCLITGHVINGEIKKVIEEEPIDCTDMHVSQGSGIYTINPKGIGRINVYCDLDILNSGGGWTVFQRRETGEEDFNREWIDYENIRTEFWLGNSNLNIITAQGNSLQKNNNQPFSTSDKLNVEFIDMDCANYEDGPWWFTEDCTETNLNGEYLKNEKDEKDIYGGIYWNDWQYSNEVKLKKTTMMIRRIL